MTKVGKNLCCGCCWFSCLFSCFQSPFLLLVRVVWGILFLQAGWAKFSHIGSTAEYFASLNIMYPDVMAYVVAAVETAGGILLLLGFMSRFAALFTASTMIGAYSTAHLASALNFVQEPTKFFAEPAFSFLFASLVILFFGPGIFSIDGYKLWKSGACDKCCSSDGKSCDQKK